MSERFITFDGEKPNVVRRRMQNEKQISSTTFSEAESSLFPACFVELPLNTERRRAAFYLAAEEYVACALPEDVYLFTWQLSPTVVFGRNQVLHRELDVDFCLREGIDMIRRKSGGGCIYADRGNIMLSLITGGGPVEPLFREYARCVADGLQQLGVPVEVSGRNDIVLKGGGKVCGNAFYHQTRRNIVHGTMLYDTDHRRMAGALTPDRSKLKSAGVASVKSRVAVLKDVLGRMGVDELRHRLRKMLCDRSVVLAEADVAKIEAMEQEYYEPEYFYGRIFSESEMCSGRIEQCGRIEVRFSVKGSVIEDVRLTGDFFEQEDAHTAFLRAFVGRMPTWESLRKAVSEHHPERSIRHLSEEGLLEILSGSFREPDRS